ncbi:uncharacterized protein [Macrobrachium rosenbergii]|uniref:uncharacterized protein n=1 Tax=Macrobrachium rosenbergii TaxID=79674 RepID=UPI0034D670D0
MRIHLKPGATLFCCTYSRPIPFTLRDQVKEELDSLVKQGIITPAGESEPSEWCHPMVLAKYFTTADALHGYWQMELAEEDRHLTTFITPYGRLKSSTVAARWDFSATGDAYCLRGDMALQGIPNCVKVVDDILLSDEDLPSHLQLNTPNVD